MVSRDDVLAQQRRLTALRTNILQRYPFFGRLLLHLPFGFAACGTAYTDMKKIVFDPAFLQKMTDAQTQFVLLHETMHCVLHHCTRGKSLLPYLYNVACDVVVNSLILEMLGVTEYRVAGEPVMHTTPDGREGRLFTAEEVYKMLVQYARQNPGGIIGLFGGAAVEGSDGTTPAGTIDSHDVWRRTVAGDVDDVWEAHIRQAGKHAGTGSGIPLNLNRYLAQVRHTPKTNWRQLLHDFIQQNRSDFTFTIPDTRYSGDVIMPSFQENFCGEAVERIWVVVDTSGSISNRQLAVAFAEIRTAIGQMDALSGELSFFDTMVSEPVPFDSVQSLERITPIGRGGTDFHAIFRYMQAHYAPDELPRAVLILTDGYAPFPPQDAALGVPVLWAIIASEVQPPWGVYVPIEGEDDNTPPDA